MTPKRPFEKDPAARFEVIFSPEADTDLGDISDRSTAGVVLRRALELELEPLKQGKPLKGTLKNYRSVRAAGQRYRIVYQVAVADGQVLVVVIGIRKAGDRRDAYAVAGKRLG
jgi:mRNA interferase RelE/StbE